MKTLVRRQRLKAKTLEYAAQTLKLLAHPQRLRVIEILKRETEVPVHALIKETGFPQAAVSQHLNLMKRVGLLDGERRGKEMWYSICDPRPLSILDCIYTHSAEDDFEKS